MFVATETCNIWTRILKKTKAIWACLKRLFISPSSSVFISLRYLWGEFSFQIILLCFLFCFNFSSCKDLLGFFMFIALGANTLQYVYSTCEHISEVILCGFFICCILCCLCVPLLITSWSVLCVDSLSSVFCLSQGSVPLYSMFSAVTHKRPTSGQWGWTIQGSTSSSLAHLCLYSTMDSPATHAIRLSMSGLRSCLA